MAKRSLQASPDGAKLARKIFDRRGWTQEGLATELDLRTRQPIWRFFTCRPIERYIFIELCSILDLNWWEIADNPPEPLLPKEEEQKQSVSTVHLSWQVRIKHQERIEHQCRSIRVLGTSFPVEMESLFVLPNLLSRLASQEHLDVAELEQHYAHSLSRSPLARLAESLISASEALTSHPHVRISGKPGSGKTTLLKWVALQCQQGTVHSDAVPVLIKLGHYFEGYGQVDEFNLLHCIQQELLSSGISDSQVSETLAREGKLLLLLDELDEVPPHCRSQITRGITKFLDHFYKTRAIVVSRLVQTSEFSQFVNFELADLDDHQIETLVENWFNAFHSSKSLAKALIQQLRAPENHRIYELARVPLFLNRICQIFQAKGQLFEIRDKIYEECFGLLVKEWSESKSNSAVSTQTRISTDSLHRLGQLGILILEGKGVFFEKATLENLYPRLGEHSSGSAGYTHNTFLSSQTINQETTADALLLHGLVLEQAKGIYSFTHLAIEEYLVAWQIVTDPDLDQALLRLIEHLTEPRWREVFLIVCGMLQNKAMLLQPMQQRIESLVIQHPDLANLLRQLKHRGHQFLIQQQLVEVRSLLCQLAMTPRLLNNLAVPIYYFGIVAQGWLLHVVLSGLQLWNLLPGSNLTEARGMLNYLADQAVLLTTSLGYQKLEKILLQLSELLQQNFCQQQKQQLLIDLAVSEWAAISGHVPLTLAQIQSLLPDLYVLQLFADCLDKASSANPFLQMQASSIMSDTDLITLNQSDGLPFLRDTELIFHQAYCHWLNSLILCGFSSTAQRFLDGAHRSQDALVPLAIQ